MIKKIIVSLFLNLLILSQVLGSIAQANEFDKDEIKQFVEEYFYLLDESYSKLKVEPEINNVYSIENTLDPLALNGQIEMNKLKIEDLRFDKYKTYLEFENIEKHDDKFLVKVLKHSEIYYNCNAGTPSEIIVDHDLIIESTEEGFRILNDEGFNWIKDEIRTKTNLNSNEKTIMKLGFVQDSETSKAEFIKASLDDLSTNEDEATKVLQDILKEEELYIEELKENLGVGLEYVETTNESEIVEESNTISKNQIQTNSSSSLSSYSFKPHNKRGAKDYAYKYVLNLNPKYMNMESGGGNCANFTSQCIHEGGGIPKDKSGSYKWYYDSANNRTESWSYVVKFREYYKNNTGYGLKAYETNLRNVGISDLVQVIDSSTQHNMFVSSAIIPASANGDLHKKTNVNICQNSSSSRGRLKDVPNPYSVSRCSFVAIAGSYY